VRLARVGEPGRERPVVETSEGRLLALPEDLGDIDRAFFADRGVERVAALLARGELTEEVGGPVRYGAPVARPEKVLCIGLNYRDHAAETGATPPSEPILFMKAPNTVVGPHDEILIPRGSVKTDWEVELGVVIGRRARYLASPAEALTHVAGYCLSHDVSEREFQLERGGQWDKGKSCETFNPLGPWLVTPDEVGDPQALRLSLRVNGALRQDGSTANMIFPVDYLVWYLSQFLVLEPGDLINTGTPAGVSLGHDDVPFLVAGDVVELAGEGLGTQRSRLGQA
jgi:2-keto-4-pentenoate hydratase/2-oxohepta-3-ene-1,7-dioic acid hydratase in catechol pathway